MRAISNLPGPIRALYSDLDGTLTSDGRLDNATTDALHALFEANLPVILVTGRPAGWAHTLASLWPFAAAISENGGVSFVPDGTGGLSKRYAIVGEERAHWQHQMRLGVAAVIEAFPTAQLSADSAYREVDLAIDWNEESKLSQEVADQIVSLLKQRGLAASRSSVHVNFSPPGFDKFTAAQTIGRHLFATDIERSDVCVGDSLNDAPMFAGFASSVAVQNVTDRLPEFPVDAHPKFVTEAREGQGFRELAAHLLKIHRDSPTRAP